MIIRFRGGDMEAFRQLVEKHKDVSLSLAYSILKDQDRAEDVLQEAFLKVFEHLPGFEFRSAFTTWLYRIVVNTSYNAVRQNRQHQSLNKDHPAPPESERINVSDPLLASDQKRFIREAMNLLKADEALVLRLFYLCELSQQEIREITGFSIAKIKVDLHRGRTNLHQQLEKILGKELKYLL